MCRTRLSALTIAILGFGTAVSGCGGGSTGGKGLASTAATTAPTTSKTTTTPVSPVSPITSNGTPTAAPIGSVNTNTTVMGIFHRTPTTEFKVGAGNVVWAAAHNQFFALLAMPSLPIA